MNRRNFMKNIGFTITSGLTLPIIELSKTINSPIVSYNKNKKCYIVNIARANPVEVLYIIIKDRIAKERIDHNSFKEMSMRCKKVLNSKIIPVHTLLEAIEFLSEQGKFCTCWMSPGDVFDEGFSGLAVMNMETARKYFDRDGKRRMDV